MYEHLIAHIANCKLLNVLLCHYPLEQVYLYVLKLKREFPISTHCRNFSHECNESKYVGSSIKHSRKLFTGQGRMYEFLFVLIYSYHSSFYRLNCNEYIELTAE